MVCNNIHAAVHFLSCFISLLLFWGLFLGNFQQIHLVTGKGGVGKSAIAAALALKKASQGQKTLLVELGSRSFFQDYFSLDGVTNKPISLYSQFPLSKQKLELAIWSGESCLHEYALHLLKLESLYRLFFENPVTKTLIQVAPALSELSIAGKITSHPRKAGPPLDYDCLVIDAFATGHFLALIQAAHGMAQAVRFGPMGEQSKQIDQILRDPKQTSYYIVSIPEEMPVHEAIELSAQIKKHTGQQSTHIYNRTLPTTVSADFEIASNESQQLQQFTKYLQNKLSNQQNLKQLLQENTVSPLVELPWIFEAKGAQVVTGLCQAL